MQSLAESAGSHDMSVIVMDTAPAAILGALQDPVVRARERSMIVNIGNFHTLAFRIGRSVIEGVFEHHTGELTRTHLERYLRAFASGSISDREVFEDNGHGAYLRTTSLFPFDREDWNVAVTGPRQRLLSSSPLGIYHAVPFGDMMMSGCIGLILALGHHLQHIDSTQVATHY